MNSECTNPRCRFAHPVEFPVYIYTLPGIEVHPDELRLAVLSNQAAAAEADAAWISNYRQFAGVRDETAVDIVECPDYFCMPFDVQRVWGEIEGIRAQAGRGNQGWGRSYQRATDYRGGSRYEGNRYGENRYSENRSDNRYEGNRYGDNRPEGNRYGDNRPEGNRYGDNRFDNRPEGNRYGDNRTDNRYGDNSKPWSNNNRFTNNNRPWASDNRSEPRPPYNGSGFDRKSSGGPESTNEEVPNYDYQNVPYNYK